MSNPKVLDFSAPAEEAVTIVFPDGKTKAELPTVDQLSLTALQFLTANGEEWFELFQAKEPTKEQSQRFDHLNELCVKALLHDVSDDALDTLTQRQKAAIIVGFMNASPQTQEKLQAIAKGEAKTK